MSKEQLKEFWRKNKKKLCVIGGSILVTGIGVLLLKKRGNSSATGQQLFSLDDSVDVIDFDGGWFAVVDNDIGAHVFEGVDKSLLSSGKIVECIDEAIKLHSPDWNVDWNNFDAIIVPKNAVMSKEF